MMHFEPLRDRPSNWDELIRPYHTKTLFHEAAWLDHVQSIHPQGKIVYFEILDGQASVGFYCALRITRLLIPIHGSPLGGTGTNFMGPIVREDTDQTELLQALTALFGPRHFLHLELSNQWLNRSVMETAGFEVQAGLTHVCRLPDDVDRAFASLSTEARNRIRKSRKNGVVVERIDDPVVVTHFFEQFREVYGKQGMTTPFAEERPRSLFHHLMPARRLLPLWARQGDEILAAGLFPYDDRCIYFWGAASWLRHQRLCPNEALHWGVMQFAVENAIPVYNMCGGNSQFKNKFGGEDIPHLTYYKSALPLLKTGRRLYRDWHFRSLKKNVGRAEAG
jgi:lipid II:glycine glycyltransferase (peptidoglycan interpeptide bridge formation enzyme)